MDQISNQVELKCGNASGNAADPKTKGPNLHQRFDFYNSASQNAALTTFMEANKAKFGTIWYHNNGGNVETFKVRVPITIAYEWVSLLLRLSSQSTVQSVIKTFIEKSVIKL